MEQLIKLQQILLAPQPADKTPLNSVKPPPNTKLNATNVNVKKVKK